MSNASLRALQILTHLILTKTLFYFYGWKNLRHRDVKSWVQDYLENITTKSYIIWAHRVIIWANFRDFHNSKINYCIFEEDSHKYSTNCNKMARIIWALKKASIWNIVVVQLPSDVGLCDPRMIACQASHPSPSPGVVQTHVHWVSDAIQPSCPLLAPFPSVLNILQNQDLFQWVSCLNQVAKVFDAILAPFFLCFSRCEVSLDISYISDFCTKSRKVLIKI